MDVRASHQLRDKMLKLSEIAAFDNTSQMFLINMHCRIALAPIFSRLRVKPVHLPYLAGDQHQRLLPRCAIVVTAITKDENNYVSIQFCAPLFEKSLERIGIIGAAIALHQSGTTPQQVSKIAASLLSLTSLVTSTKPSVKAK